MLRNARHPDHQCNRFVFHVAPLRAPPPPKGSRKTDEGCGLRSLASMRPSRVRESVMPSHAFLIGRISNRSTGMARQQPKLLAPTVRPTSPPSHSNDEKDAWAQRGRNRTVAQATVSLAMVAVLLVLLLHAWKRRGLPFKSMGALDLGGGS